MSKFKINIIRAKKNIALFFLVFVTNIILVNLYVYSVIGEFDVREFDPTASTFLYDVIGYANLSDSIETAINKLGDQTSIHVVALSALIDPWNQYEITILYSAILAIAVSVFMLNFSSGIMKTYNAYIFCSPFFVAYSVGLTKEMLIFSFGLIFLCYALKKGAWNLVIGSAGLLIARPQYFGFFLMSLFASKLKKRTFLVLLVIYGLTLPLLAKYLIPEQLFRAHEFLLEEGIHGFGIGTWIDDLRFSTPGLSIFGLIFTLIKLYGGAVTELFAPIYFGGEYGILTVVQFYMFLLTAYLVLKFKLFKRYNFVFTLLVSVSIFLSSIPIIHNRYLIPIWAIISFYYLAVPVPAKNPVVPVPNPTLELE
jgi:hypothetical protein